MMKPGSKELEVTAEEKLAAFEQGIIIPKPVKRLKFVPPGKSLMEELISQYQIDQILRYRENIERMRKKYPLTEKEAFSILKNTDLSNDKT